MATRASDGDPAPGAGSGANGSATGEGARDDSRTGTAGRLLDGARTLFARRGYEGASVRAITSRADVNLGAVTYHFGSKRALYDAVAEAVVGPLRERVDRETSRDGPPLSRLSGAVEAFFEHLEENPDLPHFILQEVAAGRPPAPAVVATVRHVMRTLVDLVEEGRRDGTIRDVDPLLAAVSTVAQPVHFTLVGRLLTAATDLRIDEPEARARVTDHATRFVRAGLAAEAGPPGGEDR